MKHKGTVDIETNRLLLRRFIEDDITYAFNNWTSEDIVTKYLSWPTHGDINDTKIIINEWIKNYSNDSFYQWAIVLKDINEPIGSITVVSIDEDVENFEIGYCIGSKWWNKGYTSEAFNAIIPFLFEEVGCNKISAKHVLLNENSGKVMEKCGLKKEGILRQSYYSNNGVNDLVYYGLLSEEYSLING